VKQPEVIAFISIEDEAPDLIVSFALEPSAYRSITLLRTPAYEGILPEEERGVAVLAGEHGDSRDVLKSISFGSELISINATSTSHLLARGRVSDEEIAEALVMLKRMNFDKRFVINAA
jgi:hypothetical protein